MKSYILPLIGLLLCVCYAKAKTSAGTGTPSAPAPFLFMENKGQVHDPSGAPVPSVLFTASSGGFKAQLSANGIYTTILKG